MAAEAASVEQQCSLLREWLSLAGVEKGQIRELAAELVTEKVHQHFDAALVDEDALRRQAVPPWLPAMCKEARWRPVVYDLCAANPQCALLRTAVKELSQSEHAAEVAANTGLSQLAGGASSLQSFLASLSTQLDALRRGQPSAQTALEGMASAGEAQFFTTQLLLRSPSLAGGGAAALCERACAIMSEAAAAAHGQPAPHTVANRI